MTALERSIARNLVTRARLEREHGPNWLISIETRIGMMDARIGVPSFEGVPTPRGEDEA